MSIDGNKLSSVSRCCTVGPRMGAKWIDKRDGVCDGSEKRGVFLQVPRSISHY